MTQLDRHVSSAQHRLWVNRWLFSLGWCLLAAAAVWIAALITQRIMGAAWPMTLFAQAAGGVAIVASLAWMWIARDSRETAAMTVDKAAGLRERISSSMYVPTQSNDPFANAVVADAQRAIAGISPAALIPIRWSRSMSYGGAAVLAALGCFWLLPNFDLLGKAQAQQLDQKRLEEHAKAKAEIAKSVEGVKQIAMKNPDLKAGADLGRIEDILKQDKMDVAPDQTRREAMKGIEKLSDQLKQKTESEKFSGLSEMKRMMSPLGEQADPKSQVGKLAESLSQGDYQAAQEAVQKMKEQLAKRERDGGGAPSEELKQTQQQLAELGQKLEQLQDKKTIEKMQKMGVSEQDMKRLMEALSKKDPKQLQELAKQIQQQLQKQGMTKEQAQKMMDQLKKNQQASEQCNKMGQQMSQAAKAMQQGGQNAQQAMDKAAEQLSELEQMSQQLDEMQTQLSELDELKDKLGDQEQKERDCQQCNGKGQQNGKPCPGCNGTGKCNGENSRGRGVGAGPAKRARDENSNPEFIKSKAKVKSNKGDVIGQVFVKGKTIKGEARAAYEEAVQAAEREATDAIDQERFPPIYHRLMKSYFDRTGEFDPKATAEPPAAPAKDK